MNGEAQNTSRTRLLDSRLGIVEDLRRSAAGRRCLEDFSPEFQVCLPYCGLFVWRVGDEDVVGEANQVLFVTGGEAYRLTPARSGTYAELIITPDRALLAELADAPEACLSLHLLFRRRSRRADFGLQQLRARFLHGAIRGDWNGLAGEELMISLLRFSLDCAAPGHAPSRPTRRLIGRAKEFLEANLSSQVRLADIALAVGSSPAYLTDTFRRVEGVPLHRYLTQLRLARALMELPYAQDLTMLALGLGFSNHSHFTTLFRRAFGCTPSVFRGEMRCAR